MRVLALGLLLAASGLAPMLPPAEPAPPRWVYLDCAEHLPAPSAVAGPTPGLIAVQIRADSHPRGYGPYMTVDGALAGTIWSPAAESLEFRPAAPLPPGAHTVSVHWSGHACAWRFWVAGEGVEQPQPRQLEAGWFSPTGPATEGEWPPTILAARFLKGDDPPDAGHTLACPDNGDRVPHPPPPGTLAPRLCRHLPNWRFQLAATGEGLVPVALIFSLKEEAWEEGEEALPALELRHGIESCQATWGTTFVAIRECLYRLASSGGWRQPLCTWAVVGADSWVEGKVVWELEFPMERVCTRDMNAVVWNSGGDWARIGPIPLPQQVRTSSTKNDVTGVTTVVGWGWGNAKVPDHGGYGLPAEEDPNLGP